MTGSDESSNIALEATPCMEISDSSVLLITPLVSVMMITYNHEPYIAQAIEGVLQQETEFPIELVIGEDCSTDRTREIVMDSQQKHPSVIRVLFSEKNVGEPKNSRRTHNACRGKYIAICEGDDYWHHPKKLQIQVAYLEEHPEVGMVHSDGMKYIIKKRQSFPYYSFGQKTRMKHEVNVLKSLILNTYVIITCSVVTRKYLVEEIYSSCRFEFSDIHPCGDYQMWTEIAYRSQIKYINESLVTYNILPESASHTSDIEKAIRFMKGLFILHQYYAKKYGGDDAATMEKIIIRKDSRSLLSYAFQGNKPDLAREILENARKHQVSPGPIGFFYFIGTQHNVSGYLVRIIILPVLCCQRFINHVKWLQALKDGIFQRL